MADQTPASRFGVGLRPVYAFGLFSMGLIDLFVFLVAYYAATDLGMSDTEVGFLVSARGYIALVLSIHCGVLMDRFGTRRVTLVFIAVVVAASPIFPFLSDFWFLFFLQAIVGGAVSLAWAGALTISAQVFKGDAEYLGRFSFFARIGTATAPIVAGIMWDNAGGAWAGFSFGVVWAVMTFICLYFSPEQLTADEVLAEENQTEHVRKPFRLTDMLPRLSDYIECFALTAIAAIAFTTVAMFIRNAAYSIQTSLYVTYSEGIGFTATMIALLFGAAEVGAGIGSLYSGRAMKRYDARWLLLSSTAVGLGLILATPFFASVPAFFAYAVFTSMALAQFVRGFIQGVSQPVLFAVQALSVGRGQQGSVVGLRQTVNRTGGIVVPPMVGIAADLWGREQAFLAAAIGLGAVWLYVLYLGIRTPKIQS